jgi:two-component system cell cycle sensor histidine kinase/response regulator CckA
VPRVRPAARQGCAIRGVEVHAGPADDRGAIRKAESSVLVVDDHALVREVIVGALRGAGLHVVEAASAEEALRIVPTLPAPLAVLVADVSLPDMSGTELATVIAGISPDGAVVLISGHDESIVDGAPAGSIFLAKPFTVDALLAAIRQAATTAAAA